MRRYLFFILSVALFLGACAPALVPTEMLPAPTPTETKPKATPAFEGDVSVVLFWERSGGIAGFCDQVVVYADSSFTVADCLRPGAVQPAQLTESQSILLNGYVTQYQTFDDLQSDGAVADSMSIRTYFVGLGSEIAAADVRRAIGDFAANLLAQVQFNATVDPERDAAKLALQEFYNALSAGDYILGAELYGGDTQMLQDWNPDIENDLPAWLERACTQNGLMCLPVRSVVYRGPDSDGAYQFLVEYSNSDNTLFQRGPCCGAEYGPIESSFLVRVKKQSDQWLVLDLPPYIP